MADGEDVRDLVPDDERIRLLHIDGSPDIGTKRNFGCSQAAGEIVAHWDDDDHSAPGRLADQIQRLLAAGAQVTGYHTMRFTDGQRWTKYCGRPDYSIGTSLCYRREWWAAHQFAAIGMGEDNQFVAKAKAARVLATADAGDLMYATTHAGNTSPRGDMSGSSWRPV